MQRFQVNELEWEVLATKNEISNNKNIFETTIKIPKSEKD